MSSDILINVGSGNNLLPGQCQAITWITILTICPLATNLGEIRLKISKFSFNEMQLAVSSVKWQPFFFRIQCVNNFILAYSSARGCCVRSCWPALHGIVNRCVGGKRQGVDPRGRGTGKEAQDFCRWGHGIKVSMGQISVAIWCH